MIGVTYDARYGYLNSFGLGGVMVEAWGDIQVRLAPLSDHDARMDPRIEGGGIAVSYTRRRARDARIRLTGQGEG